VTLDTNNVNSCGPVVCPIITVNPASLPNGSVGTPYNQTVSASGGTAPYTFAISIGSLPSGLLLNAASGAITGTPTTAGTFSFTVTATDANGCSGNRSYSNSIASPGCPAIILNPSTVPPGNAGTPYNQTVTASGGTAPYTFAISSGSLPGGLTLNPATGAISGTPTQVGLFNFQIGATDAVGCQGARQYSLLIVCSTNPIVTTNADSGVGSLRQSIADACVGSTITFDMTPGHVVSPITLTSGELAISKSLTIQGPGANLLTVMRDGAAPRFRIFTTNAAAITISGLTISNGLTADGTSGLVGTKGTDGGGIFNSGTLTLTSVAVTGNKAGNAGDSSQAATLGADGGSGGGIFNNGTLTLVSSTVNDNRAGNGGIGHPSGGQGGSGGGIYISAGSATLTNSTISHNFAGVTTAASAGDGGGVAMNSSGGTLTVSNSTITLNFNGLGGRGGGISNTNGTVTIKSTIVGGGNISNNGPDIFGTVQSDGFNLIQSTSGATVNQNGGAGPNITGQNPLLNPLADNGGPTKTHSLQPTSPAIDKGNRFGLTTDQRGLSRPVENATPNASGGDGSDIGAVEVNYAISATAGTPQSATINSAFATALKATVTESGNPQNGVSVTFTAPDSGASGAFPGPSATAVASTNSTGVATAPTFTANGTAGGPYNVVASLAAGFPTADFALTNLKGNQTITFGALANKNFGDADFAVSATASSSLAVSFAASGQCTVAVNTVHITAAGSCTITASQAGNSNFNAAPDVPQSFPIANRALITLSQSNYTVNESTGFVTITVNRTGDLSVPVSVDYATNDTGAPIQCTPVSGNTLASARCDFGLTLGTLKFAANETQKTFVIPITQDSYNEGPEMFTVNLSNLTGTGAAFATLSSATVTINDSAAPAPNASDDTNAFVRQQYRDFLNRESDAAGLAFWTNEITSCGANPACIDIKRQNVSAAFFLSIEFQSTGNLVRNFYVAALDRPATNNMPNFVEFERDTQALQRGVIVDPNNNAWQTVLNNNRDAFMKDFVTRGEFVGLYPTVDSPSIYVGKLYQHALGRTPTATELQDGVNEFAGATTAADPGARGRALLRVTQAADFQSSEMNRSFVQMEYFGYLRRNPSDAPDTDFTGYNFWVSKLNQFNGNFIQAEMVKAFITSTEYRQRFGPN
jgi:hypothetical protein